MIEKSNRRMFVRALAVGASAAPLVAAGALVDADDKAKSAEKKAVKPKDVAKKDAVAKAETKGDATTKKTVEHDAAFEAEVDARMQLVLARCGSKLDEAARKSVREELAGIVERSRALKKFSLDNGDGPFPVFHPYRAAAV